MDGPQPSGINHLPLKPFLLLLLALVVLSGASLWLTAWCWPRFGERACGIYTLPVDFLMGVVIFTLVTMVFDQSWGRLLLYSLVISAVAVLGSLVASLANTTSFSPIQGSGGLAANVTASLGRLVYLAIIQTIIPAALLRGLVRRDVQRVTIKKAVLFGVVLGLGYAVFITSLFWIASIIQPGSVAPGYILTWQNMYGATTLGLAAWAGVLLGRSLRRNPDHG